MNKADIYLITNLINGKQYVGQTVQGYLKRWENHCRNASSNSNHYIQYIDKAIKKYGCENFKIELLETVPIHLKDEKEIYYIDLYDTYNKGYNNTIGGDINPMFDEKVKTKHLNIMRSDNVRQKMSKSVKAAYTPQLRKWFSNHSKNIWNSWTLDQKEKCIQGLRNYNNSKKQRVAIVDKNDKILKEFECAADACKYFNKPSKEAGHLLLNCDKYNKNGKRSKYYGNYWIKL